MNDKINVVIKYDPLSDMDVEERYDADGRILYHKDSKGNEYSYEYDERGNNIHFNWISEKYEEYREYNEKNECIKLIIMDGKNSRIV